MDDKYHSITCAKRKSLRLDCTCAPKGRIKDNEGLIVDLMQFSPYGALSQVFVIEALRRYADACVNAKPEELSNGFVDGDAWQRVAKDIKCRMDAFYNRDTADSDGGDHD